MGKGKEQDGQPLTFEQALAKLESIVQSIEQGKVGLEESIEQYEAGMKLIALCRGILTRAEQKIQQLQLSDSQAPKATAFEPGEGGDEDES